MVSAARRIFYQYRSVQWVSVLIALLCISTCLLVPQVVLAAWSSEPYVNTAVIQASGTQCRPQVINDGDGGYIVIWRDSSANSLSAQRYDASGNALWGPAGSMVCSLSSTQNEAVSDGAGGVIVSWSRSDRYLCPAPRC